MIALASLTVDNIIGLVIAVFLIVYLVVALLVPEKF
jgi:K+-transporting ATPase KdpF subunit